MTGERRVQPRPGAPTRLRAFAVPLAVTMAGVVAGAVIGFTLAVTVVVVALLALAALAVYLLARRRRR